MKPLLLLGLPILLTLPATAASLRPYRQISGATVHLSDLFDSLGDTADCELGQAPSPGTQIVLRAPQLAAIARDFSVDWRPRSGDERSILERGGTRMAMPRIVEAVRDALTTAGAPPDAEITLPGFENPVLPAGGNATLEVSQTNYDPTAANFTATLTFNGDGMAPLHAHLAGKAYAMADAAVLTHRVHPGNLLTKQDIETAHLHAALLHGNSPLPASEAAGMQLRRDIAPGQPLTRADVVKPTLVSRNAQVRILLNANGISLGAEGIAMDEGGLGDRIRVQNPSSRAIIDAEITGANEVRATPGALTQPLAQQLAQQ